jgi:hypothetical protein
MPKNLFITITPPDRTLYYAKAGLKNPNLCVFIDDRNIIKMAFKTAKIRTYILYPEFDKKGRLHYHGRATLTPCQEVSFYKSVKPKIERNIGFVLAENTDDQWCKIKKNKVSSAVKTLMYSRCEFYKSSRFLDDIKTPICPILEDDPQNKKRIRLLPVDNSVLDYFLA